MLFNRDVTEETLLVISSSYKTKYFYPIAKKAPAPSKTHKTITTISLLKRKKIKIVNKQKEN